MSSQSILLSIYANPIVKKLHLIELAFKCAVICLTIAYYTWLSPHRVPLGERLVNNTNALFAFLIWTHIHSCVRLNLPTDGTFRR